MSRFQRDFLAQFCFDRVEKKPETEKEREGGGELSVTPQASATRSITVWLGASF